MKTAVYLPKTTSRGLKKVSLLLAAFSASAHLASLHAETIDLMILAGQSNARGRALWADVSPGTHPADTAATFMMDSYHDQTVANSLGHSFYNLGPYMHEDEAALTFGPEISFTRSMYDMGQEGTAVVKNTWGGSSIDVWLPTWPLYDFTVQQVKGDIDHLVSQGHTVNLLGVAWLQGEADVGMPVADYQTKVDSLINGWRADLETEFPGQYGFSDMPAYLIEHAVGGADTNPDLAVQNFVASDGGRSQFIRTNDLTGYNPDGYHFDAASEVIIGQRLAAAAIPYTIPEPGAAVLALIGAGLIGLRRRRAN